MEGLQIRPVTAQDFQQWLPLWEGYNAFYGRSGSTALDPEITNTSWMRFLNAEEPVFALVAETGNNIIGITHYLYHRSTTASDMVCYLQDLYTDERWRGKGVGRALIEKVYEKARLNGSPRVYWLTHETNKTAMQLYNKVAEHSGFVVYRKTL